MGNVYSSGSSMDKRQQIEDKIRRGEIKEGDIIEVDGDKCRVNSIDRSSNMMTIQQSGHSSRDIDPVEVDNDDDEEDDDD